MIFRIDTQFRSGSDRGTSQSETRMNITVVDDKRNFTSHYLYYTDMGNNAEYESFIETDATQNDNILMALTEFFDDNWDVSKLIGQWFSYDYEAERFKPCQKQHKFPVRYDIFNPFLFNPVRAHVKDPSRFGNLLGFNIGHVLQTDKGLIVYGHWDTDPKGYTEYPFYDGTMEISNQHEADRFEAMLKMMKISI